MKPAYAPIRHVILLSLALGLLPVSRGVAQSGDLPGVKTVHEGRINHWIFFPGVPGESLHIDHPPTIPSWAKEIQLPHRIPLPDQSLWYFTRLSLTASQVLLLDADDGAQVFWQGQRIYRRSPGETFLLTPGIEAQLVVRVLNNAGAGGLRKAILKDPEEVADEERRQALEREGDILRFSELYLQGKPGFPKGMIWQAGPVCLPYNTTDWRIWIHANCDDHTVPFLDLHASGAMEQITIEGSYQTGLWWFSLPADLPHDSLAYSIRIGEGKLGPYSLKLPSSLADTVSITVFGDSQNGLDTFRSLLALPALAQTDLILGLGDLVGNGADPLQWTRFFRALSPYASTRPSLLIPGNHDTDGWYDDLDPSYIHQYLANGQGDRRFFRRIGPVAILGLDPNETFPIGIAGEAYDWMMDQINQPEWLQAPWKILAIHQPPYAQGWIGYEGDFFCRELVNIIRQTGGLDVVLSGHNHDYERLSLHSPTPPLHCIIIGGGGGHLEDPGDNQIPIMDRVIKQHHIGLLQARQDQLAFRILDTAGHILDEFKLTKQPEAIPKKH